MRKPPKSPYGLSNGESKWRQATGDMRDGVHRNTMRDLSDGDLAYLQAMLMDEGPSTSANIAQRMGKSTSYVAQYRRRLMTQGVIEERGRGKVAITLPGFADFLRSEYAD